MIPWTDDDDRGTANERFLDDLAQLIQAGLVVVDHLDEQPRFQLTARGRAEAVWQREEAASCRT